MSQVILAGYDDGDFNFYENVLKIFVGIEVIAKNNLEDLTKVLAMIPDIAAVLFVENWEDSQGIMNLVNDLKKKKARIEFLIIGKESFTSEIRCLNFHDDLENSLVEVGRVLGITLNFEETSKPKDKQLSPIIINYFYFLDIAASDIFVGVIDGEETYFIRKFKEEEKIDLNLLDLIKKLKVKFLYVPEETIKIYFTNFVTDVEKKLSNTLLKIETRIRICDNMMKVVYEVMMEGGSSNDLQHLTTLCLNSIGIIVSVHKKFKDLVTSLKRFSSNDHFINTVSMAWLIPKLAKKYTWCSKDQIQLLNYLAFFHNIYLKNKRMMEVRTEEDLKNFSSSPEEQELVKNHAKMASILIRNYAKAPMDMDVLIAQHHGPKDGIGFPEKFGSTISPLSQIFIIVDECITFYFKNKGAIKALEFDLAKLEKKFINIKSQRIVSEFIAEFIKEL